jgi:hypothetical protein
MDEKQQNSNIFMFVVGWLMLIFILTLLNRTRLGHVVIYYSLMLLILMIVASEYQNIVPFLGGIQTVGQLNAKNATPETQIKQTL